MWQMPLSPGLHPELLLQVAFLYMTGSMSGELIDNTRGETLLHGLCLQCACKFMHVRFCYMCLAR